MLHVSKDIKNIKESIEDAKRQLEITQNGNPDRKKEAEEVKNKMIKTSSSEKIKGMDRG